MKLHLIHGVIVPQIPHIHHLYCSATDQRDDVHEHVRAPCLDLIPPVTTSHPVFLRHAAEQAKVKHSAHATYRSKDRTVTATDAAKVMHLERRTCTNRHECTK